MYGVLCRLAGTKGQCYPAVATIAARLDVGVSTVNRTLATLAAAGLIAVEARSENGLRTSNEYTILDVGAEPLAAAPEPATPIERPALSLWDRVVGPVADAPDNASKVGALRRSWSLCFGPNEQITPPQAQQLISLAGSAEAVAQQMLRASALPDIRSPFGLVRNGLAGYTKGRPQPPARRADAAPDYGAVKHDSGDIPF